MEEDSRGVAIDGDLDDGGVGNVGCHIGLDNFVFILDLQHTLVTLKLPH